MKFNRNILLFCILAVVCDAISEDLPPPPRRSLLFFPQLHKPFSIFTRPPPRPPAPDEPHKGGGGILSHVLQGGSIGIEIRPLAPLQGILDHAKKLIPGGHGTVGRPNHERPDYDKDHDERPNHDKPPYHERPNKDHGHYERPGYERPKPPYHERPNKDHEHYVRPNRPQPPKKEVHGEEDPQWEDIGEVSSTGGEEEEDYGEGVLQPRNRRPKRFVESRIYHVPLMFRSNGRADKVRIKGRMREKTN